jgi:hypothetical protein
VAPQYVESEPGLTQVPAQLICPAGHDTEHAPAEHTMPAAHALPAEPTLPTPQPAVAPQ